MLDYTDLSAKDFHFNPNLGTYPREIVRDMLDRIIRRPIYSLKYRKKFADFPYKFDLILPEKGMSTLARRQWINQYALLKNSRILVIGCGDGWDFSSYLRYQPKEILGVDLYNFSSSWAKIQDCVRESKLTTRVSFKQADITELDKIGLGEFDIICSDAVFEHFREFEISIKVLYNLLQPQGIMYASYGPLWYTWGGDHFSGRGGTEQGYNHLLLQPDAYQEYYQKYLLDEAFEVQNGGRYIELDLFSHLSSLQYINSYDQVGFKIKSLIVEFSEQAEKLKSTLIFKQLTEKFNHLTIDDFLIKSHLVILEKS